MNLSMFSHEFLAVLVVCTLGSKKKCFSIALRHTLVVLEMH